MSKNVALKSSWHDTNSIIIRRTKYKRLSEFSTNLVLHNNIIIMFIRNQDLYKQYSDQIIKPWLLGSMKMESRGKQGDPNNICTTIIYYHGLGTQGYIVALHVKFRMQVAPYIYIYTVRELEDRKHPTTILHLSLLISWPWKTLEDFPISIKLYIQSHDLL